MEKEKLKKLIIKYIIPYSILILLVIPFVCIDGSGIKHIYFSPIQLIIKWDNNAIIFLIYSLINIAYIIFVSLKNTKINFHTKRVLLYSSLCFYIIIFKKTSNTNLNLLCVFINIIVGLIYLLNFIREYSIQNPNK